MKKLTLLLIGLFLSASFAWAEGEKQEIQPEKLPKFSHGIIQSYFPGSQVVTACKEKINNAAYEAVLDNGVIIQFDKDGQWCMVDCGTEAVPANMVHGKVKMYMAQKGIDTSIVKMEKDKKGNYTYYLSDTTELHFDNQFRFME